MTATAPREGRVAAAVQRITATALGPYQSAIVRIGFGGVWLLFLLRELPHRHELYGPRGPWSWELGRDLISGNDAFTVLMWTDSGLWFEVVYALAVLAAALLMLGWRTRAMSALFMVGVLSLQNRSIFMGDGGDNVIHLMAIYLVLTRCSQVWSLDAWLAEHRRARTAGNPPTGSPAGPPTGSPAGPPLDRVGPVLWGVLGFLLLTGTFLNRTGWQILLLLWAVWLVLGVWWAVSRYSPRGQPHLLMDSLANVLHNATLVVIMAEVCLIYATAGWYKVQGSRWQDGTALYYPLQLDYFTPWPALSDLLAHDGVMVMALTYGTVIVQVAFPFTLFNRRVKNVLLVVMILEHAAIAVVLGLPFFSLAMIAADAVFLPTSFLRRLGALTVRGRDRLWALTGGRERAPAS
ncbi:HTTM domain-containing protein [Streptomyces inusitatus]|uniref:HTTM domain-containing protein n=1 Tax=Streptomyces inusitatus TaxID=68221 RepID=A0A918PM94_9ACTN|nr:HTTM domain-containing protein [Streptomyces inusitatus]GGZ15991.1 HTTM domain-containing protein [Streptomyces inusitatus]